MNIGDIGSFRGILCKFVEQDGGVCYLETPHGSRMRLGRIYMSMEFKPLTEDEQKQYDLWVIDAARQAAKAKP